MDKAGACGQSEKTYELAAAFVVEDELLEDEESLLEAAFAGVDSVLAGAESLLDSPALSLTVLDPPRLSVR